MKTFADFLQALDTDKFEHDVVTLNFSKEDFDKLLSEFTPDQFRYVLRISRAVSLALLRQYDSFLREQSDE